MGRNESCKRRRSRASTTADTTASTKAEKNMSSLTSSVTRRAASTAACSTSSSSLAHSSLRSSSSTSRSFAGATTTTRRRNPAPQLSAGKKKADKKAAQPEGLNLNLSFDDGIFAPAVRIAIAFVGLKDLNKFRGKAIALHSQVITSFCKQVGAPAKTKQGLIRLAKKNGHDLGFLVTTPAWTI